MDASLNLSPVLYSQGAEPVVVRRGLPGGSVTTRWRACVDREASSKSIEPTSGDEAWRSGSTGTASAK
jgi:hypothetical protein